MSEILVNGKLPILALRGLAVFPDQTIHFDVGRPKSIRALESAMKGDQNLLLIPQKDLMENDPGLEDLYTIGVGVFTVFSSTAAKIPDTVIYAGYCLASLPLLIAFFFTSKQFIKGLTDGAVKM